MAENTPITRAEEVQNLLKAVQDLIIPFIRSADESVPSAQNKKSNGHHETPTTTLVEYQKPEDLREALHLQIPAQGTRQGGLIDILQKILRYSVNTWHQGFLDKLYASTNAPGLAAELILATLNTNLHVYQVSPALTVIEKYTGEQLARLFGLNGRRAGGITVQGGSASNTTSIVVARNNLYPTTKEEGNQGYSFVLFTSAHGHYSVEKAAQMLGFGSKAVWSVPVDKQGRMIPNELEKLVEKAKSEGRTPFYVNATAGTTVMGSFDPFHDIAAICQKHKLWFHVDGSWGGSFVFSRKQRTKLSGVERADSITVNPHKMLGVPVTCSFLLSADLKQFHRANTLPAGYLFHNDEPEPVSNGHSLEPEAEENEPEYWDLADLTLQCGRRGDALKLFLGWSYYGTEGYEQQIDTAHDIASHLANIVDKHPDFILISESVPPCLQVCFYYAPGKEFVYSRDSVADEAERGKKNSQVTERITREIVSQGFMVDFAPPSGDDDAIGNGKFFRCVVNVSTIKETVDTLVNTIEEVGSRVVADLIATERIQTQALHKKPRLD